MIVHGRHGLRDLVQDVVHLPLPLRSVREDAHEPTNDLKVRPGHVRSRLDERDDYNDKGHEKHKGEPGKVDGT